MYQAPKLCIICQQPLSAARILSGYTFCSSQNCEPTFRQHLLSNRPCCGACGRPLQGFGRRWGAAHLCDSRTCQLRAAQFPAPTSVCQVCSILLEPPFSHSVPALCSSPFCQNWHASRIRAKEAAELLQVSEQRRQALAALAVEQSLRAHPELNQGTLQVAVLPYFDAHLTPPSKQRLDRVEALLLDLAMQAHAINFAAMQDNRQGPLRLPASEHEQDHAAVDLQADSKRERLLRAACATCGGQCCRPGGDTGFLNIAKFRELMLRQPDVSPEKIVLEYVQRIPTETVSDSCIFHGRQGCVLPRELRTVTCNTYFCTSLQQLRDVIDQHKSNFLLVATNVRDDGDIKIYRIAPQLD